MNPKVYLRHIRIGNRYVTLDTRDMTVCLHDGEEITERLSRKGWDYIEKRGVRVPERKTIEVTA